VWAYRLFYLRIRITGSSFSSLLIIEKKCVMKAESQRVFYT
jgi:hypothetical protein